MLQLKETGLRYGDSCTLISPLKPKKSIALNRTRWDILPEADQEFSENPVIAIPGAKSRSFRWRLELETVMGDSRFLLRSLDGSPFTLNGQWGREAFLEGSDILGFTESLGRLEFSRLNLSKDFLPPEWPEALQDEKVLASKLSVLLVGETGTGKSHLARELHRLSKRTGEFVALNAAALAPSLVESELFGHSKGAFTGAHRDRAGALEAARHGTLFLDEVDSLPKELQVKLLLSLDHGRYRPVGSDCEKQAHVRFVFASGKPLEALLASGHMRQDFYYRLEQGVTAHLKSLRDAPANIIRHCQLFCLENHVTITPRLMDFYRSLPWPGNVRQLRGHLQGKRIRSKTGKLDFDHWDEKLLVMSSDLLGLADQAVRPMEDVKREYARQAFIRCQNQLSRTARELGVNVKTLKTWLEDQ